MTLKTRQQWLDLLQRLHARLFRRAVYCTNAKTPITRPGNRYEVLCDPEVRS